ncbi:MAG: Na+/H+ antiporter [Gemmatimonadetes bacterium]|nr:Na+/H+ antiporter [Gemmatimonadota bacterium]
MRDFQLVLLLLLAATLVQPLARRLDVPLAIAQVVAGIVLSILPFFPTVSFDGELSFALLVPPLLYRAASTSSLRDTRRHARPILLLAVALVLVTTLVVALVAHLVAPQLPWASALVLGAMVSPPDADITTSIARRLGLPSHLVTILEGETLLNDATAFISYRFAVRAALVGTFSLASAVLGFGQLIAIGVAVGLALGWSVGQLRQRLGDTVAEGAISLLTPFAAYFLAEGLGGSGVLSVVVTGFFVSRILPHTLTPRMRVRGFLMWETVTFMIGGFVFLLIGLQLGNLAPVFWQAGGRPLVITALAVTAAVIGTRLLWVLPALYLPRVLDQKDAAASGRTLFVLGWAGLRGGDTLVMALAIPATIASGQPFPGRDVIVPVALAVILATIVVQGLTLRPVIKWLGFPRDEAVENEERRARMAAEGAALAHLQKLVERGELPADAADYLRTVTRQRTKLDLDDIDHSQGHDGLTSEDIVRRAAHDVRDASRRAVVRLRDSNIIGDEAMRRVLSDLDLEDLRSDESFSV